MNTRRTFLSQLLFSFTFSQEIERELLSPIWKSDDPRLEQKISLQEFDILTGDLTILLSKLSGVTIECDNKNCANGLQISCLFKTETIYNILKSVESALSYRNAPFGFKRSKSNGSYTYLLQRSSANFDHVNMLNQIMIDSFKRYFSDLIIYSTTNTDEFIENEHAKIVGKVRKDYGYILQNKNLFARLLDLDSTKILRLFARYAQVDSTIASILKGDTFSIQKNQLSDIDKKMLSSITGINSNSDRITFHRDDIQEVEAFPSITCAPEAPMIGFGARHFAIGFENEIVQNWITRDDTATHPIERQRFVFEDKSSKLNVQIFRIIQSIHQNLNINIVLLIPKITKSSQFGGEYKNLEGFLLFFLTTFLHKWNQDTLILATSKWHLHAQRSENINFELLAKLRNLRDTSTGLYQHTEFLALLADQKTDSADFASLDQTGFIKNLVTAIPLLRYCIKRNLLGELLSTTGVPAHQDLLSVFPISQIPSNLSEVFISLEVVTMPLTINEAKYYGAIYRFWLRKNGKPLIEVAFTQIGNPIK